MSIRIIIIKYKKVIRGIKKGDKMINSKIIAGIFVLGILSFLIFSGPAQAFILGLVISDNEVQQGEKISFEVSVEMEKGDKSSDVNYFILSLRGPANSITTEYLCKFNPNGSILDGCSGIKIKKNPESWDEQGFCEGYGYPGGKCIFSYNVTLGTKNYAPGKYETLLIVNIKKNNIRKRGGDITINPKGTPLPLNICSLRADGGTSIVEGRDFGNKTKLNLFISFKNSPKGQGSLVAQKGRDRLSYRFNFVELLENNNNKISFSVSGKYRIGPKEGVDENAVMTFDKIKNTLNVKGENVGIKNMKINFREGC